MTDTDPDVWDDLGERIDRLDAGTGFVTPVSERQFRIEAVAGDRVTIRFRDSGEERPLWREQFGMLARRLSDGPIAVADLQPGVEPYASVLSALGEYDADGEIARAPGTADESSPYLVSPAAARTRPERLHDDAPLLADALDRPDASDPAALETESLADLYVLLSDVQRESDSPPGSRCWIGSARARSYTGGSARSGGRPASAGARRTTRPCSTPSTTTGSPASGCWASMPTNSTSCWPRPT